MTATYEGSVTIGGALPGALAAGIAGQTAIAAELPYLQAELSGLLSIQFTPPSLTADISAALEIVANLQASLDAGFTPPDASVSINAQVAVLGALIASINAQLTIIVEFLAVLGTAGVHVFKYSGSAEDLGTQLGQTVAETIPGQTVTGWLIAASADASVEALNKVLI